MDRSGTMRQPDPAQGFGCAFALNPTTTTGEAVTHADGRHRLRDHHRRTEYLSAACDNICLTNVII